MTFKFLHTADLHLDSPLKALALRDPDLAETVGTATRTTLTRIVDLCLEEEVDALLIAGDLWDGKYSSTKTPRFLKTELNRLDAAGIACFIIRGNHDAESKLNAELDMPANTVVFTARDRTRTFRAGDMDIAVHGLSMPTPHVSESLLPKYPQPVPGAFNIGMMHTSLNGSADHSPYAPCALADLDAFGYGYWALGHIHKRAEYHGAATVVMPGTPQGRDIGEAGETSVSLVTVQPDGTIRVTPRSVAGVRFEKIAVPLDGIDEWSGIIAAMSSALRGQAAEPVTVDAVILRPVLSGRSRLAWRIRRDLDSLTDEARVIAEGFPALWIDKLELQLDETEDPAISQLPADLVALVQGGLVGDPALAQAIGNATEEFLSDLPADLRALLGETPDQITAQSACLLRRGAEDLLTRLSISAESE
ncbi:metallophosphoesterase family protein [Paracoccus aminophilus]|uniref:Metallophosphoesterase n=1 Tax=Paracoccus aminophilus JCM 7686 TaxID=1367847 RepID=S5XNE2_PARAH|nr:DNA repair exonuclease [Paracoccus aminophilus]AGT08839.1 metallophosphoesterase [Paracoccus aminophilus JCM 7686]